MAINLSNGKVIISDKSITIKKFLSSEVIQKHQIKEVEKMGGMINAIISAALIITIWRAIPMFQGKYYVTLKTYDKEFAFWLTKSEYQTLMENL